MLRALLRSDHIAIENRISVDNLGPVLSFVGKLGNPEKGGVPLRQFRHRQELYRRAEVDAMKDVPEFIRKARDVFGYFVVILLKKFDGPIHGLDVAVFERIFSRQWPPII